MAKMKKCPVCDISIKLENLENHLKKVHPGEKIALGLSLKEKDELTRSKRSEKQLVATSRKKVLAAIAIPVVIVIVASALIYIPAAIDPPGTPHIQAAQLDYDFGILNDPATIDHTFTIENTGDGILEINKMETSCHCTTVNLIVGLKVNGPFGMGGSPGGWWEEIEPGESATLTVYYDTLYHAQPDEGHETRIINVYTNDPSNPRIQFEIEANIVRT